MAAQMNKSGVLCDAIPVWDIRRRWDRALMDSPLADAFGRQRIIGRLRQLGIKSYDAILVLSPHRFSVRSLQTLKEHGSLLVAVLGDDPAEKRAVSNQRWSLFDRILSADASWLERVVTVPSQTGIMPWGSTLINEDLLSAQPYEAQSLVIVGAPYRERVRIAETLASQGPLTLQGSAWPGIPGACLRPSSPRLETLKEIRRNREMVVNIHHPQFKGGLNPQFFDYAAAGIPQVVVYADSPETYQIGLGVRKLQGNLNHQMILHNPQLRDLTSHVVDGVRESYLFHSCVERALA